MHDSPRNGCNVRGSRRGSSKNRCQENLSSPRSPPDSTAGSCQSSPTHPHISPSTPLVSQRSHHHKSSNKHDGSHSSHMTKQHSFDVGSYSSNSKRNDSNSTDRPREMALSRSYSFMSRPRYHDEDAMHERFLVGGMRSVESTPQPRRKYKGLDAVPGSPDSVGSPTYINHRQRSDSSGLESLVTPMMHRKQRSLETGGKTKYKMDMRPSNSAHNRFVASDSSPSPPITHREFTPFNFDTSKCPDSGTSTLTDKDTRSQYGRGSADSSPHSQVDSGLVSGTTGSRGSVDSTSKRMGGGGSGDSRMTTLDHDMSGVGGGSGGRSSRSGSEKEKKCNHHRRHHHCSKHRQQTGSGNSSTATVGNVATSATSTTTIMTDSDRSDTLHSSSSSQHLVHNTSNNSQHHNNNSSSASSTANTTKQNNNSKQLSPSNISSNKKLVSPTVSSKGNLENISAGKASNNSSHEKLEVKKADHQNRQDASSPKHRDMTHLYSNIDYIYEQPVYQFIMEQAKLSG